MPMLDPYTGQLIGTIDRLKTALQSQPVLAPGKTDLPPEVAAQRQPMQGPPKIQDRLSQAMQPQPAQQQPIDATFQTVREPREGMPPAPLTGDDRDREVMRRMGRAMMQFGTPAQQVQGMKLLSEASRPSAAQQAEADKERYRVAIEDSTASDGAKERALTMLELGASPEKLMEALQFDARGLELQTKQMEDVTKNLRRAGKDAYEIGIMEREAERAVDLIDNEPYATGMTGYALSYVPWDNPSYNLGERLTTLKTILGYDELSNMRQESPTGGAIGQVTEMETRWLQATQGSLDQFQNPQTLKENIRAAIEGKRLIGEMHSLVDAMNAGDMAAIDRYREIVYELGNIGQEMRERTTREERNMQIELQPGEGTFEQQYGGR